MKFKNLLFFSLFIIAFAFTMVGCNNKDNDSKTTVAQEVEAATVLGKGQTKFFFTVVDKSGNTTNFEIHTDKKTVGDALLEHNLISGEDGQYGLYVKTVNGITADYDVDKTYWAFYVNGAYSMSGVDTTDVKAGEIYSFKQEK